MTDSSQLSSLDTEKFLITFRKKLPLAVLIAVVVIVGAYLYLRYTKPLYESSSELKFDFQSEAQVFGFNPLGDETNNLNNISGEIELIRSKVFLNKVIQSLPLKVSYFLKGNLIDEDRYKASPIVFHYDSFPENEKDRPIDISLTDNQHYQIKWGSQDEDQFKTFPFDKWIIWNGIRLNITVTSLFSSGYFNRQISVVVNSQKALHDYVDNNLTVAPQNLNANTIKITFTDHSKEKAHDMVEQISKLYVKYSAEEKNRANQQKIAFLDEQLHQTEKKLESFENYFEDFTIANKSVDLENDLKQTIVVLNELDSSRQQLNDRLSHWNEVKSALQNAGDSIDGDFILISNGNMGNLWEEYRDLKKQLATIETSYKANTQAVQKIKTQMRYTRNQILDATEKEIESLQEQKHELLQKENRLEASFLKLPGKSNDINQKRRFYKLYEEFYLNLMQKKAEFEIAKAGTLAKVIILTPATVPAAPVSPKSTLIYLFATVGGVLLGFIFIASQYLLNDKVTSEQELERIIPLPVLGGIPYYRGRKSPESQQVVLRKPHSSVSEALRAIRTNLEFVSTEKGHDIITVTSATSGEGKSFVSVNLATIMAFNGIKTILVDMDLRKPSMHQIFGYNLDAGGLSTCLIKKHHWSEVVQQTEVEGLDVISAGPIPPNPSELLSGSSFDELLTELRQAYDLVIFDTPPVGMVTDAVHAMRKASIPIFVVRADYTRRKNLKMLERLVNINKLKDITLILNCVKSYGSTYAYQYGGYYAQDYPKSGLLNRLLNLFRAKE